MHATLHIENDENSSSTQVLLEDPIKLPYPKHPVLLREWQGFSYQQQVVIVPNEIKGGLGTTIHTRYGSGRGQAAAFDKLVGRRLAEERKQLARQLRQTLEYEGDVTLKLTTAEVAEIEERIQTHSDGLSEDEFVWGPPQWYMKTLIVTDESFSETRSLWVAARV